LFFLVDLARAPLTNYAEEAIAVFVAAAKSCCRRPAIAKVMNTRRKSGCLVFADTQSSFLPSLQGCWAWCLTSSFQLWELNRMLRMKDFGILAGVCVAFLCWVVIFYSIFQKKSPPDPGFFFLNFNLEIKEHPASVVFFFLKNRLKELAKFHKIISFFF